MSGRLYENTQVTKVFEPKSITACAAAYNGHGVTVGSASGIDTLGYDDAMITLNLGAVGATTLDVDVLESATDSAAAATIITNAAGTEADYAQKTSADQNLTHVLGLRVKDHKRYLFIRAAQGSIGATVYGINILLSKADSEPVTQTNTVDFNDSTP